MAALYSVLIDLITQIFTKVAEDALKGQLQQPATKIVDSVPDPVVDKEVSDELEASIAAGRTPVN